MDFSGSKEKVLKAAKALMLSKGYPSTTVEEICDLAEVSKGTFYNCFDSKEELGLTLLQWYHEYATARIMNGSYQKLCDPITKMYGFLDHAEAVAKELWGEGCLLATLGTELSETSPKIRRKVSKMFKEIVEGLAPFFEPACNPNRNKVQPSTQELAEQFLVSLEGSIVLAKVYKDWKLIPKGLKSFRNYLKMLAP
jgi:TetR/AcrR family transcriptional repressor of nem operon